MPVSVVTDSVASIPADDAAELGIDVVSLYINDGESNQLELEMDVVGFYRRIQDMRTLPTSSQPSVDSLVSVFKRAVDRGSEVLGVFVSHKMSGTFDAACLAADIVIAARPGARIELLDSGSNSLQEGFGAITAAKAARAGESIERCIQAAEETLRRTRYLFTPSTLEYLRRGGRISAASAMLGGLLQIKPILTVENGEAAQFGKVRTQGRALTEIARKFASDVSAYGLRRVVVHYIGDIEPAERFAREHVEPLIGRPVRVIPVSPVVGLHVGPAVALVYETELEWL